MPLFEAVLGCLGCILLCGLWILDPKHVSCLSSTAIDRMESSRDWIRYREWGSLTVVHAAATAPSIVAAATAAVVVLCRSPSSRRVILVPSIRIAMDVGIVIKWLLGVFGIALSAAELLSMQELTGCCGCAPSNPLPSALGRCVSLTSTVRQLSFSPRRH